MGQAFGCFVVTQSNVGITEQFGKFEEILEPGCHFVPWFLGRTAVGTLSLRVQQLDVRCQTKTKDNVFATVVVSIQYQALRERAKNAFYSIGGCKYLIKNHVSDVVRSALPRYELDAAFERKDKIAKAIERKAGKATSAYGYQIVKALIVDIEPDASVKKAMNEINAASRMRVAANDKAEAEKIVQIKKAEGEAEAKYLHGLGTARQRQAIVDGLRDSVINFSDHVPGTTSKDVMDMVMMTQYFDTMKDIGASPKSTSIFIPYCPVVQINDVLPTDDAVQTDRTWSKLLPRGVNEPSRARARPCAQEPKLELEPISSLPELDTNVLVIYKKVLPFIFGS